jgi:hypothetical protein
MAQDDIFALKAKDAYARMLDLAASVPPGVRVIFLPT